MRCRERERESKRLSLNFNSYFIKTVAVFFCAGFLFFGLAGKASAATYKVGVLTDAHTDTGTAVGLTYVQNIITLFGLESVDSMLMLGDMIADATTQAESRINMTNLNTVFAGKTARLVLGNHEKDGQVSYAAGLADLAVYGSNIYQGENFTFDHGNWRFISLETVSGTRFSSAPTTITWLTTQLTQAQADGKYIIIASHASFAQNFPGNPAMWIIAPDYTNANSAALTGAITPSDVAGTITITNTVNEFVAGDVGRKIVALESTGVHATCLITAQGGTTATCTVETGHEFANTTQVASGNWGFLTSSKGYSLYAYNAYDIRTVVEAAKTAGADIKAVIFGHGHGNLLQTVNGIPYYEFPSTFGKEGTNTIENAAIMSLESDGTLRIAGASGATSYNSPYYFTDAVNGNDTGQTAGQVFNAGRLRNNAKQTLAALKALTLTAGDTGTILPGTYRESVTFSINGVAGNPIFWNFESGAKVAGAYIVSSWAGPDVNGWYSYATTTEAKVVIEDGILLTEGNGAAACLAGQWDWITNTLYYCPSSGLPGAHTVESGALSNGLSFSNSSAYLDINGGEIYGFNTDGILINGTPNTLRFNNNISYTTAAWGNVTGVDISDLSSNSITLNRIIARNNKTNGFYFRISTAATLNNSIARNNGSYGVRLSQYLGDVQNPTINHLVSAYNNTGFYIYGSNSTPTIKNSIFYGNTTKAINSGGKGSVTYSYINGTATWGNTTNGAGNNTGDPLLTSVINYNLLFNSPAIDSGTNDFLTTDYAGNSIYGMPDIGTYEYQPPYTIGTNNAPTTGSIRIYSDGKYRMKTASTTSATANFNITPQGGSYQSTTTQYMDITIDSWLTSGTYNKQWTATSTAGDFLTLATSTTYTIGDLAPNAYYQFKIDGSATTTAITGSTCNSNGTCLSNSSGIVTFTYSGGYSTHTFVLETDVSSPAAFALSSPANNSSTSNSKPTLFWNASSDSESGLSHYQLYIDNGLDTNNISVTSVAPTNALSCGNHSWYVKAIDNAGNSTNSNTFNLSMVCGGTPVWLLNQINQTQPQAADNNTDDGITPSSDDKVTKDKNIIEQIIGLIKIIAQEASEIVKADVNVILSKIGFKRDLNLEKTAVKNYVRPLAGQAGDKTKYSITNFIAYGTPTTLRLGKGERAGVVNSYKSSFNKLPTAQSEWEDVIKIANGRWPSETNQKTEQNAVAAFRKIYLREPDRNNINDDAAITIIAYGLRPACRNMDSEKKAIRIFKNIYGYNPFSATAWDVVRAIAYSGATR